MPAQIVPSFQLPRVSAQSAGSVRVVSVGPRERGDGGCGAGSAVCAPVGAIWVRRAAVVGGQWRAGRGRVPMRGRGSELWRRAIKDGYVMASRTLSGRREAGNGRRLSVIGV